MRLIYIGGGFVGTCSAAVMADAGHNVLVLDINKERIEKLSSRDLDKINSALSEEYLAEYILRNGARLGFSHDLNKLDNEINSADAVFLCLPTPEKKDKKGQSDLSLYKNGLEMIGNALKKRNEGAQNNYIVIVNKSTVPINTVDSRVIKILDIKTPGSGFDHRNYFENIQHLSPNDQIKFVLCDRNDYEWAKNILRQHDLTRHYQILFSPSHAQLDNKTLAEWILEDQLPVRFQLQLHKYIWGDVPGR